MRRTWGERPATTLVAGPPVRYDQHVSTPVSDRQVAQRWPWLVVDGVLGIIAGIIALVFPGATVVALAIVLGVVLLVQGIVEIVAALRAGHGRPGRWWIGAFGVASVLAGILVLTSPGTGVAVLVIGLLLWFVVTGVNDLFVASSSREHRGWNIAMGVLALLAAVFLLFSLGAAIYTIAFLTGLGFLMRGGAAIGLGLSLRRSIA